MHTTRTVSDSAASPDEHGCLVCWHAQLIAPACFVEHVHVTSRSSSPSKGSPCSLLQRRHYAEHKGYWEKTKFLSEVDKEGETTYYDSVTGKPLFIAPRGRTFEEFKKESIAHGWPSFRDEEVVWENMRCLANGESVSVDGTHLGHNLPDRNGNRYYIQSNTSTHNGLCSRLPSPYPMGCAWADVFLFRVQVLHQPRVGRRRPPGVQNLSLN